MCFNPSPVRRVPSPNRYMAVARFCFCKNNKRTIDHNDVAKSITVQELQRAKEEFMCHTTHELCDEMELWPWDEVQHNRWARALKASHRVGVRPIDNGMWRKRSKKEND
jgi:hypothetical protein